MAYFTSLWQARIIENHRHEYENEKFNSLLISNTEIPRKTVMQRWRIYGHHTKRRMTGRLKKWFPKGSSVSNLYYYLKTDQTFPNFVLKSIIGFLGGIVLTYICFMFFVFQLSISLIHATIMSSIIGVLLTLGLAFSYRIRCLVFLLIPQFFSRVGRYTLTCYALVLILTGPATNTLKNLEVLSESMACSQEQIKSSVRQITQSMKTPFNSMRDSIKLMVDKMKRVTSRLNDVVSKIGILVTSIGDEIQTSLDWLSHVIDVCNRKLGTPYDHCMKAVTEKLEDCKKSVGSDLSWICNSSSVQPACLLVKPYDSICVVDDYFTTSFAATLRRRLRSFTARVKETFFVDIETRHTHTFSSNSSASANQVAAGIVTEIRHRADPLLKWLSWSSCVTSLFLLLIIFRAKYYQQMFETRSRFDNRYVTKELRELDLKRYLEGRETVLPLNRRERAKYISIMSYKLMASEKVYLTRAIVFMTITTFKLLIHMVADYSLYWILMNIRYHGRFQSQISPGPSDGGVHISGTGFVSDMIRSLFDAMTAPLITNIPSPVTCLPNPHPPDMKRYTQIAILILLLWLFALFEPYGLRLRHVIMGHYRPERAKARAVWLYNHILRTRGSFMKLARRKLHREYKYSFQDDMSFRHLVNSFIPWWCLKYVLNTLPNNEHCLLCNTLEDFKDADTKLISCETIRCPGVYCLSCFSDIGKLCTICLSPADYGDVSDVSLENGSSDEFSDDEGCGNTSLQSRNNGNERTSLIKKSNADNRKSIPKRKKEGGQYEACNVFSSDDDCYRKLLGPALDYYRDNINDAKDGDNNLKFTDNNGKSKNAFINDIKHENTNLKPFKTTSKKAKDNLRNRKFKCRRKFKQKHKTMTLKRASRSIFYRFFVSLSQYAIMKRGYKLSLNRFDFRRSSRYIRIHKSTHTKKLPENLAKSWKSLKRSNNKINKNVNRRPSLKLLYAKRFKSYPIQNSSLLINANIAKNIVGSPHNDNVGKSKKNGNKKSNDKVPKKGKFRGEQKKRCQGIKRMYKICSSCFISMKRGVTPSKEILHNLNNKSNPYSADKSNFKRRKKEKEHFKDRSNVAIENENTRNYRISTYLFDNLWIKGKFGKDGKIDDRQRDNDNEFVKDRKEAGDQQDKEMEQLKISKKTGQMKAAKCTPPFRDCKCKRKPENRRQSICTNNFSCFRKRCCCNVHSSNSDLIADDKNKAKNNMSQNKLLSSSRADPNITRRMNYYRSIGISDFENTSHIDARCQNNCRPETVIHPSTSQRNSPTGNGSGGVKFDFDRSTSLKSFKIKEVKLGISDRFLHLRIRNPLPIMKELYATLLEASKREKTKTHVENNYITAEKGVLALPAVESHECQCINEMKPVEHRTTQIYTRDKSNIKKQPKCITPRLRRDVEVHVTKQTCTCATQYKTITEDKACSCVQNNTAQDFEDAESQVTESTESVCSLSEGTKTDTTICSRFEINYDESPRVKIRSKRRIHVVTKANRSTTTEKATLCDVSTITNDWWSPIVEKKLKKQNLFTKPIREERIKRKTRYARDRSVSTDGKIVTFLSRAQIIPTDASDILSPSRYLLESQRYYNELFSSRIYSPRVFPAIFLKAQDHGKRTSSRDSISTLRKGNKRIGKPKKFDKKGSLSFKTKIGKTRSDDSSLKH